MESGEWRVESGEWRVVSRVPVLRCGSYESETMEVHGYLEQGQVPLNRDVAYGNMDGQDAQDNQGGRLLHRKLTGSMIECAFVDNLSVLRGPSRTPFDSFPTPWNSFAHSSFAALTDPIAPLVEIFSPFPTIGGTLSSLLQPLSGPSSSFVALRGLLFLAFADNAQLFQISLAGSLR